ncbi:hypothetical protein C1645_784759 [Glomus cerebriforme]|uniref:Uncharacterized protein n=1 Tax=Glomus cerebriforme TaxID=658196 RepID=A0A397SCY4_9GLOM|nr:hypothetical protein C1645_784759 [Glomus cerebriforme]
MSRSICVREKKKNLTKRGIQRYLLFTNKVKKKKRNFACCVFLINDEKKNFINPLF